MLSKLEPIKKYEPEEKPQEDFADKSKERSFDIRVEDGVYFVENAPWLLSVMETIEPDNYDSLQYFERVLRSSGIIDALIKNGINEGDIVSVYDIEFDYVV